MALGVDKMSLLLYFKRWIPTPEEAGIGRKETEAANKEAGMEAGRLKLLIKR